MIIDLRSDTVTRPTEEMLECMRRAEVGDDSRDGDPTVEELEGLAAQICGKQAAAFMPSGTMSNLVALLAHGGHGGVALMEESAHIFRSEMGSVSTIAGLLPNPIPGQRGAMDLDNLGGAINGKLTRNRLNVAVVCMESSHNEAGGAVLPLRHMEAVHHLAESHDVPVHLDGARLFNAACRLRVDVRDIACYAQSVSFCLSKALSAPVGSLLVGTTAFVERARAFRRMLGGNMRQAGILAAAGIVALTRMVVRLEEDHRTARELANGFQRLEPTLIDPESVETNIVRLDLGAIGQDAGFWCVELKKRNVLVAQQGKSALRFVTHRHIDHECVGRVVRAFADIWKAMRHSTPKTGTTL